MVFFRDEVTFFPLPGILPSMIAFMTLYHGYFVLILIEHARPLAYALQNRYHGQALFQLSLMHARTSRVFSIIARFVFLFK